MTYNDEINILVKDYVKGKREFLKEEYPDTYKKALQILNKTDIKEDKGYYWIIGEFLQYSIDKYFKDGKFLNYSYSIDYSEDGCEELKLIEY